MSKPIPTLTSLVLKLQSLEEVTVPLNLGRASHALFLRLIAAREPALATQLHDDDGPRPFTCSNLIGGTRHGLARRLTSGDDLWLRFTGLTEATSHHIVALAADPPPLVELDGVPYRVAGATLDPSTHPWAAAETYQTLADRWHSPNAQLSRRITLEFISPTAFRSQNMNVPFPLPHLVFGSLLSRWQAFAPIAVSPDTTRYAQEMVALSRYELRTRNLPFKQGAQQVGFVGQAGFTALNNDRYWLSILHLLADYSFFAGVGYQTPVGMGQTRMIKERE